MFFKHFYEVPDLDGAPCVYVPLRDPFEALMSSVARERQNPHALTTHGLQVMSWRRLLAWSTNSKVSFVRAVDIPLRDNVSNPHPAKDAYAEHRFKIARGSCPAGWDEIENLRRELFPFLDARGVFVGPWHVGHPVQS